MPVIKASDGHEFYDPRRARLYERSLMEDKSRRDIENAPGGPAHAAAIKEHGPVREVKYAAEGSGRHRLTFTHADGKTSTSVHPEAYRAHSIMASALGIDNPPAAINTHQRAKNAAIGPKENENIRRNDHREEEDDE